MDFLFVSLLVFLFICLSLLLFVCLFVCFRTRQKFEYLRLKMQEKTKKLLKFQRVQKVAKNILLRGENDSMQSDEFQAIFNMLYAYFMGVCWCCGPGASMQQNNVAIHNKFEKYTQLQNTTQYQTIFPLTPKNTLWLWRSVLCSLYQRTCQVNSKGSWLFLRPFN